MAVARTIVVIPTYMEADNIVRVLERVRASVPDAHVLVVDDGSPDGTAAIAESTAVRLGGIDVLCRAAKTGLGSAYRDGFAWALARGFDVIVEMDADLSHDPAELPSLLRAVAHGADLAIGSRYVPGGSIPSWPWHRRLLSSAGNRYAAAMLRLSLHDLTSGYRAYRASLLSQVLTDDIAADGYGFQIEMAWRMARAGGVVREVPITFVDRTLGSSKLSRGVVVEALLLVSLAGLRVRLGRPDAALAPRRRGVRPVTAARA